MKIGLIGEAPNDTRAIQKLLSRKYHQLEFVTLLNRINGSRLDNHKLISRVLRLEYEIQNPDIILFIRDLDALEGNNYAKRKRKETFSYCNRIVDKKGLHLLNIYELEALILADIVVFNRLYSCRLAAFNDPMAIEKPKEVLIEASRYQYEESHSPEIFALLDFETLMANCRYFKLFVQRFEKLVSSQ